MRAIFFIYITLSVAFVSLFHPYRSEVVLASRPHRRWFFIFDDKPATYEIDIFSIFVYLLIILIIGIIIMRVEELQLRRKSKCGNQ